MSGTRLDGIKLELTMYSCHKTIKSYNNAINNIANAIRCPMTPCLYALDKKSGSDAK